MKKSIILLILIASTFISCSSKDSTLIDTQTQQRNAKEALKEL